jgi:hypothetical protein
MPTKYGRQITSMSRPGISKPSALPQRNWRWGIPCGGKWNPKEFHDTYHEDLMALIEKRIKADKTETIDESEPKAKRRQEGRVIDLMALKEKCRGESTWTWPS